MDSGRFSNRFRHMRPSQTAGIVTFQRCHAAATRPHVRGHATGKPVASKRGILKAYKIPSEHLGLSDGFRYPSFLLDGQQTTWLRLSFGKTTYRVDCDSSLRNLIVLSVTDPQPGVALGIIPNAAMCVQNVDVQCVCNSH